jgi:hypothetical protein
VQLLAFHALVFSELSGREAGIGKNIQFVRPIRARLSKHRSFLEAEVFRPASSRLSNDQVIKEADLQDPRAGLKKCSVGHAGPG